MYVALNLLCFDVPFTMMFADLFFVYAGVGGCEWPISDRAVQMDVAFWQFSNNPPNYASVSDAMKFIIMLHSTCNVPFSGSLVVLVC